MKKTTKSAKPRGGPHGLGAAVPPDGPCREKYWRELNLDEKVERLRHILKMVDNTAATTSASVRKTQDEFVVHTHAKNGKVLIPVQTSRTMGLCNEGPSRRDPKSEDVYF